MKKKTAEATITDVADLAGVSVATVSRVLNNKGIVRASTAAMVTAAMDKLSYPRGREVDAQERNDLILVVLPTLENPFYTKIIQGIKSSAEGHGLEILIYPEGNVDGNSARILTILKQTCARGLIILSPVNRIDVLDKLSNCAQLVQCAEYNEKSPLPYVGVDDVAAARLATQTLIDKGCKRIALINGPEKFKYARHRYKGYADALKAAKLPIDDKLVVNVPEMDFESSLVVAQQMLQASEHPDAILAASDLFATAVVKTATAEGIKIPDDLHLIGFDNTFLSQVSYPSVATINLPRYQLGYMACEVLVERIKSPESVELKQFLLKTELVMRDSL